MFNKIEIEDDRPRSADEALQQGAVKYRDDAGCDKCGAAPVTRYTENGACVFCVMEDIEQEYYQLPMQYPEDRKAAKETGEQYYLKHFPMPCPNGPHPMLHRVNAQSGKKPCVICDPPKAQNNKADMRTTPESMLMKTMPDMIISKKDAKAAGLKVYRTGKKCRRGHDGFRYVSNGGCIICKNDA